MVSHSFMHTSAFSSPAPQQQLRSQSMQRAALHHHDIIIYVTLPLAPTCQELEVGRAHKDAVKHVHCCVHGDHAHRQRQDGAHRRLNFPI